MVVHAATQSYFATLKCCGADGWPLSMANRRDFVSMHCLKADPDGLTHGHQS